MSVVMAVCSLLACGLVIVCAGTASAVAPSPTGSAIGYDVSYPQCGVTLPKNPAFGIVGLNGTLANNFNPCLDAEASWASRSATGVTTQPDIAYYVHTADPGTKVADWPNFGTNPDGVCSGGSTNACAYQYGERLALNDLLHLGSLGYRGVSLYIDAEAGYAYGPATRNNAVLEGMVSVFRVSGDNVGVYSDAAQWQKITGNKVSPVLSSLPVWMLGAHSTAEAWQACMEPSFAGPIMLAQAAGGALDQDVDCGH